MNSLRCFIDSRDASQALWCVPGIGEICCADLRAFVLDTNLHELRSKRVAIGHLPELELLTALLLLDGNAKSIVLLPLEADEVQQQEYMSQQQVDCVLNGEGFGFGKWLKNRKPQDPLTCANPENTNSHSVRTEWYLPTSGTTGRPKLIQHDLASLTRSIRQRDIGSKFRWASLYSFRRFAGLQVFLQSVLNATPLIVLGEQIGFAERIDLLGEMQCNALSATPSMWRKLLMTATFEKLNLSQITLGGEIVDQALLDTLVNLFPEARITHVYASTEAGVGFSVSDGRAGFPAEWLAGNCFGTELALNEDGELKIHRTEGPNSTWLGTGDLVRVENGRVYFLGRANGSINVGGNKVMPEEIESVINGVTGVAFAQVRGRKNPILGQLVEAVVIPMAGVEFDASLKKAIVDACKAKLEPFKVPAFLIEGGAVELTSTGKVSRT